MLTFSFQQISKQFLVHFKPKLKEENIPQFFLEPGDEIQVNFTILANPMFYENRNDVGTFHRLCNLKYINEILINLFKYY